MADFHYVAVQNGGKQVKGNIDAPDMKGARNQLKAQNLTVVQLSEASLLNKDIQLNFNSKIKPREIGIFCRQMNSILNAGVPVVQALAMLSEQTEKKSFKKAIQEAQSHVEKGESLADALRQNEKIFPHLLVSLVQAGEESGSLDTAFERMAVHFEKRAKLSGMVKKAMIYPIMILIVAVVVVVIMSVAVMPQFASMFESMGTELPLITKIVMGISDFMINRWYVVLAVVLAVVLLMKYFLRTDAGKHWWGRVSLKLPIFGNLTRKNISAGFARTMTTLIASGMDVPRAIEISADSVKNVLYRDALMNAKQEVERGIPMSEPIKRSGLFPPMVGHMTAIGEETGAVDDMLEKVAEYYEEEVEIATGSLTAAMEPLIIVVMGVIVGFIVMAIYSPMISMYSGLDQI